MSKWESEFEADWSVPAEFDELVRRGALVDTSWHNDTMPSFGLPWDDGEGYRFWVDHPDAERRENPAAKRFSVSLYDGGEFLSDSVHSDEIGDVLNYLADHHEIRLFSIGDRVKIAGATAGDGDPREMQIVRFNGESAYFLPVTSGVTIHDGEPLQAPIGCLTRAG